MGRWTVDEEGWLCEDGAGIFQIGRQLVPSSYVIDVLNRADTTAAAQAVIDAAIELKDGERDVDAALVALYAAVDTWLALEQEGGR